MTVTAKALASALLTYDLAVDAGPPTLATRVDAMRQVLEQFVANSLPPRIDPAAIKNALYSGWRPPAPGPLMRGDWEEGWDGIIARPVGHVEVTPNGYTVDVGAGGSGGSK